MSIEQLLVAVDFSEGSRAALGRAIQIARQADARLCLLHAMGPPGIMPKDAVDSVRRAAKQQLEEWSALVEASGAVGEARLHEGSALEAFAETETELSPDLVVLGARGHSALRRVWLGSVADGVVREANAPVLVVRGDESPEPFRRFLCATDFSPDADAAAVIAAELAGPAAARHVVHVWQSPYQTVASMGSHSIEGLRREARERLDRVAHDLEATPHYIEGSASHEIPRLAAKLDCDLVAVGAIGMRPDGWLQPGGISSRVARRSAVSVLVGRTPSAIDDLQREVEEAQGAIGRALGLAAAEARSLQADVREIARMSRDARGLEDELLAAAAAEVGKRAALVEADHPALAEALSRIVRVLARMGI